MTFKQILDENLDTSNLLVQVAELQKISDGLNKIQANSKMLDPSILQQKDAFSKLVAAQLQQKKMQAQQAQLQAQQKQVQQIQNQNNPQQISTLAQ
jgi:hypothetical protein